MATLFYRIAKSQSPIAQMLRRCRNFVYQFTLPAPRILVRPFLCFYIFIRNIYYFLLRVFLCEPLFKANCKKVGKGVRTDIFIPFITGMGDIIVGDQVLIDGRFGVTFASRYSKCPQLVIGDRTRIGHNCGIIVAKEVTIGKDCLIASDTLIFDSSGHCIDPAARLMGLPPSDDMVKPVHIGDNVWIGKRAMIFPGVTIGNGAVVAAGSYVIRDVAENMLVSGNPARPTLSLAKEEPCTRIMEKEPAYTS